MTVSRDLTRVSEPVLGARSGELLVASLAAAMLIFIASYISFFPYRNQNTYLLHAIGSDNLAFDWLKATVDPFPVATKVSQILVFFGRSGLAAGYFLCAFIFAISTMMIVRSDPVSRSAGSTLLAVAIALPWVGAPLIGANLHGLAEQYMLGGVWQPSEAGAAALVLAIGFYVAERPLAAALAIGVGVWLHPGSAFGGVIVMGGVVTGLLLSKRLKEAMNSGLVCLAICIPAVIFVSVRLGGDPPEAVQRAEHILVHYRIPHHALPNVWFDIGSVLQVAIVILGILLLRKHTRLGFILAFCAIASITLTAAAIAIDRDGLYLLFPWRVFAILVPLTCSLISARLLVLVLGKTSLQEHSSKASVLTRTTPAVGLVLLALGVVVAHARNQVAAGVQFLGDSPYNRMLAEVSETFPPAGRTYVTKSEAELLRWAKDDGPKDAMYVIPLELETFRMFTGNPVYVDWKSHPYKPTEFLAWFERVTTIHRLFSVAPCPNGILADQRFAGYNVVVYRRDAYCGGPERVIFENIDFVVVARD